MDVITSKIFAVTAELKTSAHTRSEVDAQAQKCLHAHAYHSTDGVALSANT